MTNPPELDFRLCTVNELQDLAYILDVVFLPEITQQSGLEDWWQAPSDYESGNGDIISDNL